MLRKELVKDIFFRNTNKIQDFCVRNRVKLITILAFFIFEFTMCFRLTYSALWYDEWVEYNISQLPIKTGQMYENIIGTFQPPLYNFILHFWLKICDNVFWFRFFGVFVGTISGISIYKAIDLLCAGRKEVASVALICIATCYEWIYCVQECSEYSLCLCFISVSIWMYLLYDKKNVWSCFVLFILACVGAIYSQYGSVFVIVPLLIVFFVKNLFSKTVTIKKKVIFLLSYCMSSVVFALPLYWFFLRIQMHNNEIGSNLVSLHFKDFAEYFITIGKIVTYFYDYDVQSTWSLLGGAFSIILLVLCIVGCIKKKFTSNQAMIIAVFWISYTLHFFLTKLGVYGVTHPGELGGFYVRYSYFYLPVNILVCAILWARMQEILEWKCTEKIKLFTSGVVAFCMFF